MNFFGAGGGEALELAFLLHLGSAVAVLAYFRRSLSMPLLRFVGVATAGSALSGAPLYLLLVRGFEGASGSAVNVLVGVALLLTAVMLRLPGGGRKTAEDAGVRDMLIAGVAQGVAVVPGISRSGTTLAALLMLGYSPAEALRLSFLMAVPAILGLNLVSASGMGLSPAAVAGTLMALGVSFLTIHLMLRVAERERFSYLCLLLGILAIGAGVMGLG